MGVGGGGSYLCMVDDHRGRGGGGYLCMVDDDCVWAGMEVRVVTCVWLMITVVGVGGGG